LEALLAPQSKAARGGILALSGKVREPNREAA
jgi:hypothetical protein